MAAKPKILLYDEATTGLDPIMTDVIDEVILEMKEKLDVTIVTITHHMESARKIGDRGRVIHHDIHLGKLFQKFSSAIRCDALALNDHRHGV